MRIRIQDQKEGRQPVGITLQRRDFRAQYGNCTQGLFIFQNPRRIPKDQPCINVGQELSTALSKIPPDERSIRASVCLADIVASYKAAALEHIEVLFTPSLRLDAIEAIRAACRNRKLCVAWPGIIQDNTLTYATPDSPEYYQADIARYTDTYIITD